MATGSSIRDPGGDIALWGPTGSGKTWLIHALAKELVWYSRHDPEFDYQVMDQAGMPVDISPPSLSVIGPTHGHEDRSWQFQRTPRQESKSHQISAHTHNINVHDDKGASLVEALQIPDQHPMTLITLRESTNVIALLDPTLLESSSVQSPINLISGSASSNLKSKAEYAQMIQYLCHLMVSQARNQDERYLAVCITKIDLLNIRRDPNILIEPLFGTSMAHILDSYKNQIKIKIFATSAVGSVRVELQDVECNAIPGHALDDMRPVYGDQLDLPVSWRDTASVGELAGCPVRLRFELKDADIFSIRFTG